MENKLKKFEDKDARYPSFFNRYFGDNFLSSFMGSEMPSVNVKETNNEYKVEVSAPGFDKGDFDIRVDNNVITISGASNIANEEKDEDENVIRQEFSSSSFSRSFALPENVDVENISAKEKNGILKIRLPKDKTAVEKAVKKVEIE